MMVDNRPCNVNWFHNILNKVNASHNFFLFNKIQRCKDLSISIQQHPC